MMLRARMLHLLCQTRTEDLSSWLLLAAAGAVMLLLLVILSPRLRRRPDSTSDTLSMQSRSPGEPSPPQQRTVERDMQTLMHELSEMARKVGAQLDARAARLEQLIRDADERLARANTPDVAHIPSPQGSNGHSTTIEDPTRASAPAPAPAETATPCEIAERHAQIYALQDEGLSPYQIADRLARPQGEVELIIALRPRGRAVV